MIKINKRIVRYLIAGSLSYALELTTLLSVHKFGHLTVEASTAIAFWVGLILSFIFQKLFAFRDYQKEIKAMTKQIGYYIGLVLFNYAFTLAVVAMLPSRYVVVSRTIALVITAAWNYFLYKRFIFREVPHRLSIGSIVVHLREHRRTLLFAILATLPILAFFYQYLATPHSYIVGDFDYYAQAYEAFRITILHYHQLPLWNPWMSGGVPLFANPQFGLISLQSLLVIPFGAIYGLKLAYVIYAVAGFWGMYVLCRNIVGSSVIRSVLIGYIWVFSGFFAGHNISHFTTTGFFLLPWLLYCLARRDWKYSWLWFGILVSTITLSAIDFVLLTIVLILAVFFIMYRLKVQFIKRRLRIKWEVTRNDLMFLVKSGGLILVLSGYRFIMAYYYVVDNPRPAAILFERRPPITVILQALFLPIGTLMKVPSGLQWGWGEYSMYLGLGVTIAFGLCLILLTYRLILRRKSKENWPSIFVCSILVVGLLGFLFAVGDFGLLSPYHILRLLPGYSGTRVSSRWLFLTSFSILVLLAAWKSHKRIINILLLLSAVELFVSFGPPRIIGNNETSLPPSHFSNTFQEYNSGDKHLDSAAHPLHSYYYATSMNLGEIYSDEAFVDTLDRVIGTDRCGINTNPSCNLVLTHNAKVSYWAPDKITISRTGTGEIDLNMNVASGWRINGVYPFASIKPIDPTIKFVLPSNSQTYTLLYAPKFSPQWFTWRISKL